ncbi:hypothetical protein [Paraburkholderia caffeinitolerans]|nr:hypothetical protein [Paraburkholderia caffeinitolerans]
MTDELDQERHSLSATPGDVLLSRWRVPYPGLILQGFSRQRRSEPEIEPYFSFKVLREFLEFLEFVVCTERIIVPIPVFSKRTDRIVNSKRNWVDFSVFHLKGDLDLDDEAIIDRLAKAGVLHAAHIGVGDPTADDVAARLTPTSRALQREFSKFLAIEQPRRRAHLPFAAAQMAFWYGAPLHVAESASLARVPYILSHVDEKNLAGYEGELLRIRKGATELLLDRLNAGAKREISKLAELGAAVNFPETPIASMIVRNATSPSGLIDAALELRREFAEYRAQMNQLESDLTDPDVPLKRRLKRARELDLLANSLWPDERQDLRTAATSVSEAFLAIPEVIASPSVKTVKTLAEKLISLPVERVVDVYRKRRVRLLMKARRQFLHAPDLSGRLAKIFDIPFEVVERSRHLSEPRQSSRHSKLHLSVAEKWQDSDETDVA